MTTEEALKHVCKINESNSNIGLFIWFIAPYWGGIGQDLGGDKVDWNASYAFTNKKELGDAVEALEARYETRKSPETGQEA